MKKISLKANEILVLRTTETDSGASHYGFVWPKSGMATAPDWNSKADCGGGLHGLPRGCGDGSLLDWSETAAAQIVRVNITEKYFEFDGKCKFESGEVVYFGKLREAIEILCSYYPDAPIVGRAATAGYRGTATAGYRGTATAGDRGTATAGDGGTLVIKWWDGDRYRLAVGYINEGELKPNTPYKCDAGKFIKAGDE